MTVRLEPLRRQDIPRCAALEKVLYAQDDPWSEAIFRSELDAGYLYLGAYVDGVGLVGYAGMSLAGPRGELEANVHNIGVDPDWQRRGIGRALLGALLAKADEVQAPVFLEVRTDNDPAIALYQAHGFTTIGLRPRYYQPSGSDAYTMARPAQIEEPA